MRLPEEVEQAFIALQEERGIRLEGNILKVLETDSEAFKEYIQNGLTKDDELRKKRLEITRQVQEQNKKSQFELIGSIVQVALWIIMGVGVTTTLLYAIALFYGSVDTTLLGNTWSNLFGILLTNSFSIIGTIMGVKYATDESSKKSE